MSKIPTERKASRRQGKPPKAAGDLASRVDGMPRFSVEVPGDLLATIDAMAKVNDRSRNGEIRVLLAEAVAARKIRQASS